NTTYAVYAASSTGLTVTNNTITNATQFPVYLTSSAGLASLTISGNTVTNGPRAIGLSGSFSGTSTLPANLDLPLVVDATLTVTGTLNLAPGLVLKFRGGSTELVLNQGTLHSQGTAQNPIYLTSYRDDAVGGDTNNDGAASAPAAGDWGQIFVFGSSA